ASLPEASVTLPWTTASSVISRASRARSVLSTGGVVEREDVTDLSLRARTPNAVWRGRWEWRGPRPHTVPAGGQERWGGLVCGRPVDAGRGRERPSCGVVGGLHSRTAALGRHLRPHPAPRGWREQPDQPQQRLPALARHRHPLASVEVRQALSHDPFGGEPHHARAAVGAVAR